MNANRTIPGRYGPSMYDPNLKQSGQILNLLRRERNWYDAVGKQDNVTHRIRMDDDDSSPRRGLRQLVGLPVLGLVDQRGRP